MGTTRISPHFPVKVEKLPVGILTAHGTTGEKNPRVLYCDSPAPALRYIQRVGGRAVISRTRGSTRWIRFETSSGVEIFPGTYCSDAEEMIAWRDYCQSLGIRASGIASMALRLMRSTLAGYFDVHTGDGIPWHLFPPGPRMHALPGVHRNVVQADIRAAYLWSIGELSPPVFYDHVGLRKRIRPSEVMAFPGSWAEVTYKLNHYMRFGPIAHMREDGTTAFPNRQGQWTTPVLVSSFDLENILRWQDRAADVRIRRAWLATKTVPKPFFAFLCLIAELRSEFPHVAKQAGNTLWGTFGASSDLSTVEFSPGSSRSKITKIPPRPALALPIAALTLSRLRARTIEVSRWLHTIQVHTDGYMTIAPEIAPRSRDASPGEWRLTRRLAEVEILNPSWYRGIDADTGEEFFKLSGRSSSTAISRKIFHYQRDKREI